MPLDDPSTAGTLEPVRAPAGRRDLQPSPGGRDLVPALMAGETSLARIIATTKPRQAVALFADLKAELEDWVAAEPQNYMALVQLGELDLRTGLLPEAQTLLYRASLLRPPSWEAYQRTSLLLRRAEEDGRHRFDRVPGAPFPFIEPVLRLVGEARSAFARRAAAASRPR